jgi:hypothetical protein
MKTTVCILIFVGCIAAIFTACSTKKAEKTADNATKPASKAVSKAVPIAQSFYQTWLASREEDKDGMKTYRPTDGSFKFPPSRGRTGYIFEAGGKGSMTYPGPTDATAKKPLTWKMMEHAGARLLTISVQEPDNSMNTKTFIIDVLDDKILQMTEFVR